MDDKWQPWYIIGYTVAYFLCFPIRCHKCIRKCCLCLLHKFRYVYILVTVALCVFELLQHMNNQELTRRIATDTLYSTTVIARTIMKLSADPATAIKNAQVIELLWRAHFSPITRLSSGPKIPKKSYFFRPP